jgi:hypothetical protein
VHKADVALHWDPQTISFASANIAHKHRGGEHHERSYSTPVMSRPSAEGSAVLFRGARRGTNRSRGWTVLCFFVPLFMYAKLNTVSKLKCELRCVTRCYEETPCDLVTFISRSYRVLSFDWICLHGNLLLSMEDGDTMSPVVSSDICYNGWR